MILWLDFETRSRCDLISRGVYNYAQDGSTDVLCMSYAFDDEDVQTWTPDQPFPEAVRNHKGQIRAHNAAFERLIFWYVLQINFDLEQFYCTAAQARANCAPGSLEDVGRFASVNMKKDHRGSQLIRLLSIPRADGTFNNDPALMAEMIAYCEQDVRAMRAISLAMRELSNEELLDYHVNERINDRGILVDVELAKAAVKYADLELSDIQSLVSELTDGQISTARSPKMKDWVAERVGQDALKLMDKDGRLSIDKSIRNSLLQITDIEQVPPLVNEVLQLVDDLQASSVAKFSRMISLADEEDYRVRGAFIFAGGSATGRSASYGLQLQNMPNKPSKEPDAVRRALIRGHSVVPQYGKRITDVLKSMLRPAIIPAKGNVFVCYDWNAIEARVNPWLSSHASSKEVLDVFIEKRDIYIREAAGIFRCTEAEVTPAQRTIGKVAILACGFGGSVGAFAAMGRIYGIDLPEADAKRTVNAWRRSNPWAVEAWGKLESAYMRAMRNPNREFTADRITYLFDGQHLWYALPSKRILCYPFARLDNDGITYAKAAWKPAMVDKEWPRARLWHGIAIENCVQATANDLLRHACRVLDAEGFATVATIHDEILVECKESEADKVAVRMNEIMSTPPDWCKDLPLSVAGGVIHSYE